MRGGDRLHRRLLSNSRNSEEALVRGTMQIEDGSVTCLLKQAQSEPPVSAVTKPRDRNLREFPPNHLLAKSAEGPLYCVDGIGVGARECRSAPLQLRSPPDDSAGTDLPCICQPGAPP
jgi:hypothetical protein